MDGRDGYRRVQGVPFPAACTTAVYRQQTCKSVLAGVSEPVIRQAELKGAVLLTSGKPLVLGSVDIPSSTNHLNIRVVMEPLR